MDETNDPPTRLRIETEEVSVEVEGTAEDVAELYDVMRHRLMETFEESMVPAEGAVAETQPLHRPEQFDPETEDEPSPDREPPVDRADGSGTLTPAPGNEETLKLIARHQQFTKVHLVENGGFRESFLGGLMDPTAIGRLYVCGEDATRLREALRAGRTLWRQLTPQGQAAVDPKANREDAES